MHAIKNDPEKYVKRSDLISRTPDVSNGYDVPHHTVKVRDFASAEIDKNFYVIFDTTQKDKENK